MKEAIFQGLASLILPLVAIKAGQNAFSHFGRIMKDQVTINTKEHISIFTKENIQKIKIIIFCIREIFFCNKKHLIVKLDR